MSQTSINYANGKRQPQQDGKPKWNAQEKAALLKLRREAKAAGATLQNNGEGGLRPSLVLGVFRKGGWACSNVDCPSPKRNITIDHISGHPEEIAADKGARNRKDLKKGIALGHVSKLDALHVLCAVCHDAVHERERELGDGKKPEPMPGQNAKG
jgi:hypothetical protein